MRRLILLLLMSTVGLLTSLMYQTGCDDHVDVSKNNDSIQPEDPEETDTCCSDEKILSTSVSGNNTVPRYYWLGLMKGDSIYAHGDSVLIGAGNFGNVPLRLSITGWDDVPADEYIVRVFATDNAADVGNHRKRSVEGEAMSVQVSSMGIEPCPYCCHHPYKRNGRFYAGMIWDYGDAVGAYANIKTRYGKLCGQGYPSTEDTGLVSSSAWVSTLADTSTSGSLKKYMQVGYAIIRSDGIVPQVDIDTFGNSYSEYDTTVYVEITTWNTVFNRYDLNWLPQFIKPPKDTACRYIIYVDRNTGIWFASYRDTLIAGGTDFERVNRADKWVVWAGEISGLETDMPGTSTNPCSFDSCGLFDFDYLTQQIDVSFGQGGGDAIVLGKYKQKSKWMISVDTGTANFDIWDIDPLP